MLDDNFNKIFLFSGHLQVTDFGFAKHLGPSGRTNTICGTLQYIGMLSGD